MKHKKKYNIRRNTKKSVKLQQIVNNMLITVL